jgi:ubiquinone biosynthesis protein UbiJ
MIPQTLLAPVLGHVAATLNRNIAQSTPGRQLRDRLAGRSFAILVTGLGLRVRLAIDGETLLVETGDAAADAEVSGAPLALMALLRPDSSAIASNGVTIGGDPEIAQSFQKLLRMARPELEAELARYVGEAPAELAARAVRGVLDFARRVRQTSAHSTAEFLTEESRDLPAKAEADVHLREVDRIREDVDRAAARLTLLEERARARSS